MRKIKHAWGWWKSFTAKTRQCLRTGCLIYTHCLLRCDAEHRNFLPQLPLRNSDADFVGGLKKSFCIGCLEKEKCICCLHYSHWWVIWYTIHDHDTYKCWTVIYFINHLCNKVIWNDTALPYWKKDTEITKPFLLLLSLLWKPYDD